MVPLDWWASRVRTGAHARALGRLARRKGRIATDGRCPGIVSEIAWRRGDDQRAGHDAERTAESVRCSAMSRPGSTFDWRATACRRATSAGSRNIGMVPAYSVRLGAGLPHPMESGGMRTCRHHPPRRHVRGDCRSRSRCLAGSVPVTPYVLLVQPSLFDATRAPPAKHTAWAYCHVPNGSAFDMTERMEDQIERFAPGSTGPFSPAARWIRPRWSAITRT